jgi:hypothetical protein
LLMARQWQKLAKDKRASEYDRGRRKHPLFALRKFQSCCVCDPWFYSIDSPYMVQSVAHASACRVPGEECVFIRS